MSIIGETVYILNIDTKHGPFYSVHVSDEGANKAIEDWVKANWNLDTPIPEDINVAIDEYFEDAAGWESYWLDEVKVEA